MFCFLHGYVSMVSFQQATKKSVAFVGTSEIVLPTNVAVTAQRRAPKSAGS